MKATGRTVAAAIVFGALGLAAPAARAQETPPTALPPAVGAVLAPTASEACKVAGLGLVLMGIGLGAAPIDPAAREALTAAVNNACSVTPRTDVANCAADDQLFEPVRNALPSAVPVPLPEPPPVGITVQTMRAAMAALGAPDAPVLDGLGCAGPTALPAEPVVTPARAAPDVGLRSAADDVVVAPLFAGATAQSIVPGVDLRSAPSMALASPDAVAGVTQAESALLAGVFAGLLLLALASWAMAGNSNPSYCQPPNVKETT